MINYLLTVALIKRVKGDIRLKPWKTPLILHNK